ncbi:MAG: DUF4397 domain-containing protein [Acidimicrobiales bacterium]|nr:DUF4397 domain-containing protein [Acidimicrobiales bacterium]
MVRDGERRGGIDLELRDEQPVEPWFGFRRSEALASPRTGTPDNSAPVIVQRVPAGRWSSDHMTRLLDTLPNGDTGRDTAGIVPVVSIDENLKGEAVVVSLRTDAPRFQERLDFRSPPTWHEGAGVTLATALTVERAHSLGLRHGALGPKDVIVAGPELAVAGMGLSLAGTPDPQLPMAPEVARSGVPTVAGDVYSLGRLLEVGTAADPDTPEEISAIVADATADDPESRIGSAREFAARLEEVGSGIIRTYTPMTFADSPIFLPDQTSDEDEPDEGAAVVIPAAMATVTPAVSDRPGRILPLLVGAGLTAVIGFGLWAAATSGSDDSTAGTTTAPPTTQTTTSQPPSTTERPTTTRQPTTTEQPTTSDPTTSSTTTTTTTTAPPTSVTTLPTPPDVPAVPVDQAGLELVHGLAEARVDAYLNGELLIAGFEPGEIAGPLYLDPSTYDIDLFAAVDSPAPLSVDRTDSPLVSGAVPISGEPESLVVTAGQDGAGFTTFADDLSTLSPGQGRLAVRNPTDATIEVSIEPVAEGEALRRQAISPGAVLSRDFPAGDYQVTISGEDGTALLATIISNTEGEATAATYLADGRLILQRIGGLGSAPNGIPTGTSGLLPGSGDPITGLLVAAAGALGLFTLVGQQRLRRTGNG